MKLAKKSIALVCAVACVVCAGGIAARGISAHAAETTLTFSSLTLGHMPSDQKNPYWCGIEGDEGAYIDQWNGATPGKSHAVALTFTAPADGTVEPNGAGGIATVYQKDASGGDGARFAVWKNDEKIYPSDVEWKTLGVGDSNADHGPTENIPMKEGDKLRLILENGGNGDNDYDGSYFLFGFKWTDATHSSQWYDSATGSLGWFSEEAGNAETSPAIGKVKREVLSYEYVTFTAAEPDPEPDPEPEYDYIEEKGGWTIDSHSLSVGHHPNNSANNYWIGASEDPYAYIAAQWNTANPGTKYAVSVVFTAPNDGVISPNSGHNDIALVHREDNATGGDGTRYAVFLNSTRIGSEEDGWTTVPSDGSESYATITPFKIKAGDKIRLVLECGGNASNDGDGLYFVLNFNWTDETHMSKVWCDSSTSSLGYSDVAGGEENSPIGGKKNEVFSYEYCTALKCGENMIEHAAKEPTCTEAGTVHYWECPACRKNFTDNTHTEIVENTTGEAAKGHTFGSAWEQDTTGHHHVCETCGAHSQTENHTFGSTWEKSAEGHYHVCTACNAHGETEDHVAGDWEVVNEATETEAGQRQKSCTECGQVLQTETIPATGTTTEPTDPDAGGDAPQKKGCSGAIGIGLAATLGIAIVGACVVLRKGKKEE